MTTLLVDNLPVLRTPRLSLTVVGPQDAQRYIDFHRNNADFLAPWEPLDPNRLKLEVVAKARERAILDARAGSAYLFAIFPADPQRDTPIVGFLNFTGVARGVLQACHLGYKLDRRMQGHGYMAEAATAGIEFIFRDVQLHRIMAAYMPHNQRSAALLRRLGFTIEGIARDYLFIAGAWRDHVLTSLVNPEPVTP